MSRQHGDHHHDDKVPGGAGLSFFDPKTPAYVRGTDGTSHLKTIHLNPDELEHTEDLTRKAELVREQLEKQVPGITRNMSDDNLGSLYDSSRSEGAFANNGVFKDPQTGAEMCLVNGIAKDFSHGQPILEKVGIVGNPDEGSGFDARHMRPMPGSPETFAEMLGMHEGDHCNRVVNMTDMRVLELEILADRTALGRLRERGDTEMSQAWIDFRALSAANGDTLHATGIFLGDERFEGVNKDMLDAAKNFKDEMVADVADRLSITKNEAEKLRLDNPRAFRDEIEKSLAEGRFDDTGNKYTKRYIEAYSGAVDRLVKDETPPLERAKVTAIDDPDIETRTLEEAEAEDKKWADEAREIEEAEAAAAAEENETAEAEAEAEDPEAEKEPVVGEEAKALFESLMSKPTEVSMSSSAQGVTPHMKKAMAPPSVAAPAL